VRARYAVVGNPVAHSLSPRIHALFAAQTGRDLSYEALLAPREAFTETVEAFFAAGGRGLNVTLPFKPEAWGLAAERGPLAERAGAANTLSPLPGGGLRADNTDGLGLLRDLRGNLGIGIAGRRLLILGAGGAVRGVLEPLLEAAPATLHIANRTAAKAEVLARDFADLGPVSSGGLEDLGGQRFDLIVNAIPAGLGAELPPLPAGLLAPGGCAYDMVYGQAPTPFSLWAEAAGAGRITDGLGMLVEQAAESFLIWQGLRPDTGPVLSALREPVQPPFSSKG
jgi:shikimate dehydrogenase